MNKISILVTQMKTLSSMNIITVLNLDELLDAGWVKSIVPSDCYVCGDMELIKIIHRLSKCYRVLITDSELSMQEGLYDKNRF